MIGACVKRDMTFYCNRRTLSSGSSKTLGEWLTHAEQRPAVRRNRHPRFPSMLDQVLTPIEYWFFVRQCDADQFRCSTRMRIKSSLARPYL